MTATAPVAQCSVSNCSFNDHTHCGAAGITIGGNADHGECATFIDTGVRGGLPGILASMGVGPGADNADCLTHEHH